MEMIDKEMTEEEVKAVVGGRLIARYRHVIQPGDTMYGIAQKYGTTIGLIYAENKATLGPVYPGKLVVGYGLDINIYGK